MTLRVVVNFHADETRLSLVSRLAIANGYSSLSHFLALTATNANAIRCGDPSAIAALAGWSGIGAERLASYDMGTTKLGVAWKLGKAQMSRDMAAGYHHRYCPKCILGDLKNESGRDDTRPYERVIWLTRGYQNCVHHACPIVEVPTDRLGHGDLARFVADNMAAIELQAASAPTVTAINVDEYVAARVAGQEANPFLDSLEAYVAVDLCQHLGRFENSHRPKGSLQCHAEMPSDVERGFTIASKGASNIAAVIAATVKRETPLTLEIHAFFGSLCRWLRRNADKKEFLPVVELFQDIAERNLPMGKDDHFVVPTRRRFLHSVRSAHVEYGMPEERIYQLVVDAGLAQSSGLSSGRIYFDAEKGHKLICSALDTMTSADLAIELGVSIDRARAILDANLLPRVEVGEDQARVFSRVRRSDFEKFKNILGAAPMLNEKCDELRALGHAARAALCTFEEVVALALEGKLSSLRRTEDHGVVSSLLVDPSEVGSCIVAKRKNLAVTIDDRVFYSDGSNGDVLNQRHAERLLKTASGTVRALVDLGYLKMVDGVNPKTGRRKQYICARSLHEFAEVHVSLASLAAHTSVFGPILRDRLRDNGIMPIFEPSGRCSRYYRIEDVQDLLG